MVSVLVPGASGVVFLGKSNKENKIKKTLTVAFIASVPVPGERNSGHAKWRAKKWKEGGGGGERREPLPANPLILKNAH